MEYDNLVSLLHDITSVKAAVLGDFCLDAYYFLDSDSGELSVETGLPVQSVQSFRFYPGGAGNVARNLASLGVGHVRAYGLAGNDMFGREMVRLLNAAGVNTDNILFPSDGWATNVYTKIYTDGVEAPRLDIGNFNLPREEYALDVLSRLEESLQTFDVLVVNQQLKNGLHTTGFIEELRSFLGKQRTIPVLLDCRDYNDLYDNTIRKLNEFEGSRILGKDDVTPSDRLPLAEARAVASGLSRRWNKPVFLTRGDRGCLVADGDDVRRIPGINMTSRIDTVGAGDSMLAGLAAVLGTGGSLLEAAEFGNITAAVTVQRLFQTGAASPEEVLRYGGGPDYLYNQEYLEEGRRDYSAGGVIEVAGSAAPSTALKYALFDHDGTISVLREGWESIMKPMMIRSVLGIQDPTGSFEVPPALEAEVDAFIEKTTGIQTIEQMHGLAEMVSRSGYVSPDQVLTPEEYKEIYNRDLVKMVETRKRRVETGELDRTDFIIKGAAEFLAELDRRGLRLYLASGTDQEDVREEADFLGYGQYFHGRIFGSVGDPDQDPKRKVIRDILSSLGDDAGAELVVFGDGPVEIRETGKRGGFRVGLLSDEVRRYGVNEAKRPRLILAGADLLIPDFTCRRELLSLLFPEDAADV